MGIANHEVQFELLAGSGGDDRGRALDSGRGRGSRVAPQALAEATGTDPAPGWPPSSDCGHLKVTRTIKGRALGHGSIASPDQVSAYEASFGSSPFHPLTAALVTLFECPRELRHLRQRVQEVEQTPTGPLVHSIPGSSEEQQPILHQILRALSVRVVDWPGKAMTLRRLARGDEVDLFEQPIVTMVDLRLHEQPTVAKAIVHVQDVRRESWGEAVVFRVVLVAASAETCSCPSLPMHALATSEFAVGTRSTSEARMSAELVARASDGALSSLHLVAPFVDTELPCPSETERACPPDAGERASTEGQVTFDATWACE